MERALELDPRSATLSHNLGETYLLMRRWDEAEEYLDRAVSLRPEYVAAFGWKALLYLLSEGDLEKSRAVLRTVRELGLEEVTRTTYIAVSTEVYDQHYQEALRQLSETRLEVFDSQFFYVPKELLEAQIYGLMGQSQLEQARYATASESLEVTIMEWPDDARFRSSLGIAYGGLGRKKEAIREGELGVKLLPMGRDAYRGVYRLQDLARIYVMVGEFNAAIEQLDLLLSIPSRITVPLLQIDPVWAPLHDQPKFQELVERYSR